MIVGGYTLDLYCDNEQAHGVKGVYNEYVHEFGATCRAMARKDGWKLTPEGKAYCPLCGGKKLE